MYQLRPHQVKFSKKCLDILLKHNIVYLAGEVRSNKTGTALNTAQLFGATKVLFITKKKAISSIESDYKNFGFRYTLTVINYESLHKIDPKGYNLIIYDEAHSCFLGETLINGVKIKDIKIGSFQKSFNFVKGVYEYRKVLNVFKTPLKENLVKIKCNGKEIICTENHKIYTKRGWVKAKNILSTDELQVV
jgi:hypothetical protein